MPRGDTINVGGNGMNEEKIKGFYAQLKLIANYLSNVAIDLDDILYDDITVTDSEINKMKKEVEKDAYKLNLAVKDLQKMIEKEFNKC